MALRRIHLFVFLMLSGFAVPAVLAENAISLTVDATKTQQKLLHTHLVIPVKPGPLTLYYPKWIPGEHGPDGPIANLTGLKFDGATERPSRGSAIFSMCSRFTWTSRPALADLDADYDFIEPNGDSATDKLMVLEWNDVVLYPADLPAEQAHL